MIAGTIAMLTEAADEPLEDYHDSGQRAVDVEASHTYLDGHRIQSGMVAGPVPEQEEKVMLDGSSIEVKQRDTRRLAASEFVADVDGAGWILAERSHATEEEHRPPWPFTIFATRLGYEIQPMGFDPAAFVERQQDNDRWYDVEMTTIGGRSSTQIEWGQRASKQAASRADVGVALTTRWGSQSVRLALYESGYAAIWEPQDWNPEAVGRFIHEELVPVAEPLETESDEQQEVRI